MPVQLDHPGVYIEEIPSGVRTIVGVATSITAFIGRALRGPVDDPVTINNYGDFERIFGALWQESTMSYAVRHFFINGGSQALIIRVHNEAKAATLDLPEDEPTDESSESTGETPKSLKLVASSVGAWGDKLSVLIDHTTKDTSDDKLFNITIFEANGATEKFLNVSVDSASPRYIPVVLEQSSALMRVGKDGSGKWIVSADKRPKETKEHEDPDSPIVFKPKPLTNNGNDGDLLKDKNIIGEEAKKTGIYALEKADLFNLLCIPPYKENGNIDNTVIEAATTYCEKRRAMLLIDPPREWNSVSDVIKGIIKDDPDIGSRSKNAAIFFPRLKMPDPLRENRLEEFAPCGVVAGIFARTDAQRGVWKAPAGQDATLKGVRALSYKLTDDENGQLNPLGVNCLRTFPIIGHVVWGSRTREGADQLASEWKYIPVRRLALFIEESLYRGTQWVVFEPNDEPLWSQIRLNLGAFMQNLFRQGAFQGTTPREAYFVKCDSETTTQDDRNRGIVNIVVGFAPLKPAEFVIIKIQQIAGEI